MKKYDVIIIGAGASGLMAATALANTKLKVLLIEKNANPGIKMLITGGGRCNCTNTSHLSVKDFSLSFNNESNHASKFLLSAFTAFGPHDLIEYLKEIGIETAGETRGKVFLESQKARTLVDRLMNIIEKSANVDFLFNVSVVNLVKENELISHVILSNGESVEANIVVVSVGGKSYPKTGSSGDFYHILNNLGHKVVKARPALVPIYFKNDIGLDLKGLSFKNVSLSLIVDNKEVCRELGDVVFGENVISGPAALNISRYMANRDVSRSKLKVDFFPELSEEELSPKLQDLFHSGKSAINNVLSKIISKKLANELLRLLAIDSGLLANSITKEKRGELLASLKHFSLSIISIGNFDQAMVTKGGVSINEIDNRNFKSNLYNNLYLTGEVLDIDGPTGGYNLQFAFTSAYLAALDIKND